MKNYIVCTNHDGSNVFHGESLVYPADYYDHESEYKACAADIWGTWRHYVTVQRMAEQEVHDSLIRWELY